MDLSSLKDSIKSVKKNQVEKNPTIREKSSKDSNGSKLRSPNGPDDLFYSQTSFGFVFKTLAEIFYHNLNSVFFDISEKGMKIYNVNGNSTVLIVVNLSASKFQSYVCRQPLTFNINSHTLHRLTKSLKKKDHISFLIKDDPSVIYITFIQEGNSRLTENEIQTNSEQAIDISTDEDYDNRNMIVSTNFMKTIKELNGISDVITIRTRSNVCSFEVRNAEEYTRYIRIGEDETDEEDVYQDTFNNKVIYSVHKIANLSDTVTLYTKTGYPLKIEADVKSLGSIAVYVHPEK